MRRKRSMALNLLLDRHSPSYVRVNTAVSNLPQFAEAFECADSAALKMDTMERCSLW
jgi:putative endopeptidase